MHCLGCFRHDKQCRDYLKDTRRYANVLYTLSHFINMSWASTSFDIQGLPRMIDSCVYYAPVNEQKSKIKNQKKKMQRTNIKCRIHLIFLIFGRISAGQRLSLAASVAQETCTNKFVEVTASPLDRKTSQMLGFSIRSWVSGSGCCFSVPPCWTSRGPLSGSGNG